MTIRDRITDVCPICKGNVYYYDDVHPGTGESISAQKIACSCGDGLVSRPMTAEERIEQLESFVTILLEKVNP